MQKFSYKNTKLQNNHQLFSDDILLTPNWYVFQQLPIGRLYNSLPLKELASLLPEKAVKGAGAPSWFTNEGMIGLCFLKPYLSLSDQKLVERLNTDWSLQLFCGRLFNTGQMIKDRNLPSRIRQYLSYHLNIDNFQEILIDYWKDYIHEEHCILLDATVYESYIKYPTDSKLLWDCCVWVFEGMFEICKELKIKRPRSKYKEQQLKQVSFQKTKKKTYKITRRRIKALLYLLNKGIAQLEVILGNYGIELNEDFNKKLSIVKTILFQQQYLYDHIGDQLAGRIVSLFKPYLRPIVRGKENKRVEFGAKAHIRQVDGVNIIDKLSFDPYNEAKHLKSSIIKHEKQFGKCHQVGIDKIYGTNENRKYMTENDIYNCLPRKGKAAKDEGQRNQLRSALGKARATKLEGSFGNEKNHYSLKKVKARNQHTEIIWILFGVMTANAVRISKRKDNKIVRQAA